MKIVLDTNVFLVSVSERSQFHWVISELEKENYTICVTTDILNEYAEILEEHMGLPTAEDAIKTILEIPNHIKVEKYFFWQMVEKDPDDNKFVDCAIACDALYIVSEDKDLRALKQDEFFKVKVLTIAQFKEVLAI